MTRRTRSNRSGVDNGESVGRVEAIQDSGWVVKVTHHLKAILRRYESQMNSTHKNLSLNKQSLCSSQGCCERVWSVLRLSMMKSVVNLAALLY